MNTTPPLVTGRPAGEESNDQKEMGETRSGQWAKDTGLPQGEALPPCGGNVTCGGCDEAVHGRYVLSESFSSRPGG